MLPVRGFGIAVDTDSLPGGGGIDYSTEEQWTGRHWIDGKKIYQKTVILDGLPSKGIRNYSHGIINLDEVLHLSGIFNASSGKHFQTLPRSASTNNNIHLWADPDSIGITTYIASEDLLNAKGFVLVQYTCTDR